MVFTLSLGCFCIYRYLHTNPLYCCGLESVRAMNSLDPASSPAATCALPAVYAGQALKHITVTPICACIPSVCNCSLGEYGPTIDCSHRALAAVPADLIRASITTTVLYVQFFPLSTAIICTDLPVNLMHDCRGLGWNLITTLSMGTFDMLTSLYIL